VRHLHLLTGFVEAGAGGLPVRNLQIGRHEDKYSSELWEHSCSREVAAKCNASRQENKACVSGASEVSFEPRSYLSRSSTGVPGPIEKAFGEWIVTEQRQRMKALVAPAIIAGCRAIAVSRPAKCWRYYFLHTHRKWLGMRFGAQRDAPRTVPVAGTSVR